MKTITESGAAFGPYREEELFPIEKTQLYTSLGEGVKMVEFLWKKGGKPILLFVEAKTNCPNPDNRDETVEKRKKYEEFYTDVTDKFVDSLGVYTAALLGRYEDITEIGEELRRSTLQGARLRFILVITNPAATVEWLPGPKEVLENRLRRWSKIWDVEVLVLNRALAEQYGLINRSGPVEE